MVDFVVVVNYLVVIVLVSVVVAPLVVTGHIVVNKCKSEASEGQGGILFFLRVSGFFS